MTVDPRSQSRVLTAFIASGLFFMLIPGTFLGVLNLIQVSARGSVSLVEPAWIQAHGHAQVFGWVGSFILGIGFYSLRQTPGGSSSRLAAGWITWALWTTGVTMRWAANGYADVLPWRVLLPLSAGCELAAFLIFGRAVSGHRPPTAGDRLDPWIKVVITGTVGFAATLVANAVACGLLAWRGQTPAIEHRWDQRFLVLVMWGWLAPVVWGFSARWLPVLLGLPPVRFAWLFTALVVNTVAVALSLAGFGDYATPLFAVAAILAAGALHIFTRASAEPKIRGVHPTFPVFVRLAYVWLVVAAVTAVGAALFDRSGGIWGASRHAFTVGFVSVMVFAIGQRMLPAFAGHRLLWSPGFMFAGLALLVAGCTLRVSAEILAYQEYAHWAWTWLPISAVIELTAVTLFAVNMTATLAGSDQPDLEVTAAA